MTARKSAPAAGSVKKPRRYYAGIMSFSIAAVLPLSVNAALTGCRTDGVWSFLCCN